MDFIYGQVQISHRLNINKPINHSYIILDRVTQLGLEHKFDVAKNKPFFEIQILFRDDNFKMQLLKLSLDDYVVEVLSKGDMKITI